MSDRQRVGDLPSVDLKDRLSGQPLLLGYQRRLRLCLFDAPLRYFEIVFIDLDADEIAACLDTG